MRQLATFEREGDARLLRDVLYALDIDGAIQQSADGWSGWVYKEGELSGARTILADFEADPRSARNRELAAKAQRLRKQRASEDRRSRHRVVDVRTAWHATPRRGPLTVALVGVCVGLFVLERLVPGLAITPHLLIGTAQEVHDGTPLAAVMRGEVWRLVTPILLHGGGSGLFLGVLHLAFNMFWLLDLGGLVEQRKGTLYLAAFVLAAAVVPNLAQYLLTGNPFFLGMSGVVYALLGYCWLNGRYDPSSGLRLRDGIVTFMLVWLVLGYVGLFNMANIVHTAGLMVGALWGYLASGHLARKLRGVGKRS